MFLLLLLALALAAPQTGSVSGKISDLERKPVVGVNVQVFEVAYRNGRRMLVSASPIVRTSALGEYKVARLASGEYYVRAQLIPAAGATEATSSTMYYPGTPEAYTAAPIRVRDGEDTGGLDFRIPTRQQDAGVRIRGKVVVQKPGTRTSLRLASVPAVPHDRSRLDANYYHSFTNVAPANDGSFEIRGVPAGVYDLYAMLPGDAIAGDPRSSLYGRTMVDVHDQDLENVVLNVPPNVDVQGKVVVEGNALPVLHLETLKMEFGLDFLVAAISTSVASDGSFSVLQMAPYTYRLTLTGLTGAAYVEDIVQSGRSIYDAGIAVEPNGAPLRVVVKPNGGTVQGTVAPSPAQKAVAGATVALVPSQQRRQNMNLYKSAVAGKDGAFTISGVAPGVYKVFAWESIPQSAFQNAEFISLYEGSGQPVIVSSSTLTSARPTLIPRD